MTASAAPVALLLPCEPEKAPYLASYTRSLQANNIPHVLVSWNRNGPAEAGGMRTFDRPLSDSASIFAKRAAYHNFAHFCVRALAELGSKSTVVFTLPLAASLADYLVAAKLDYVLDIRDYSPVVRWSARKVMKAVVHSRVCSISSPGFRAWLPKAKTYHVSHNLPDSSLIVRHALELPISRLGTSNILTIGMIRDKNVQDIVIHNLANRPEFMLSFWGNGLVMDYLVQEYDGRYSNISFNGAYDKKEEIGYYDECHIVNALTSVDLNSRTLMANRMYIAAGRGKPVIARRGTLMGSIVDRAGLGLTVSMPGPLYEPLVRYVEAFDPTEYDIRRRQFLTEVEGEAQATAARILEVLGRT